MTRVPSKATFKAWLQINPRRRFRVAKRCKCPLSVCIKETGDHKLVSVSYERVMVAASPSDPHAKQLTLPPWAVEFITRVDQNSPSLFVTGSGALKILGEIA